MTDKETLERIEEEAEKVATNLGWDEEGTSERNDIIRAFKDGAKSERNKTIDEVAAKLTPLVEFGFVDVPWAEVTKILESLKL